MKLIFDNGLKYRGSTELFAIYYNHKVLFKIRKPYWLWLYQADLDGRHYNHGQTDWFKKYGLIDGMGSPYINWQMWKGSTLKWLTFEEWQEHFTYLVQKK